MLSPNNTKFYLMHQRNVQVLWQHNIHYLNNFTQQHYNHSLHLTSPSHAPYYEICSSYLLSSHDHDPGFYCVQSAHFLCIEHFYTIHY